MAKINPTITVVNDAPIEVKAEAPKAEVTAEAKPEVKVEAKIEARPKRVQVSDQTKAEMDAGRKLLARFEPVDSD